MLATHNPSVQCTIAILPDGMPLGGFAHQAAGSLLMLCLAVLHGTLQDTELGPHYSSPYEGYTAVEDDVLDPWMDARRQLQQGDAQVIRLLDFIAC